jgi:hypothetical protein
MITLNPVTLTQAQFKSAPETEGLFYLKLGLITNEVSSLNKLTLFSLHQPKDTEVMNRAGSALGLHQLRLLAGRLYEAHDIITTGFRPLMLTYGSRKSNEVRKHYHKLNAYFGDPLNLVKSVRHKLAFHTDDAVFRAGVALMSEDDDLTDYMCEQRGNSLFWSAEMAMVAALQHVVGVKDTSEAYGKLMDDLNKVARIVNDFSFAFAVAFFDRNFPEKRQSLRENHIEIMDAPKLTEMSLPFFYETPIKT